MDWCYHGTVDETLAVLDDEGNVVPRPGAIGPQVVFSDVKYGDDNNMNGDDDISFYVLNIIFVNLKMMMMMWLDGDGDRYMLLL